MTDLRAPVKAFHNWKSNAHLIADVARLGYLRKDWVTLDPTYGRGVFWSIWKPDKLVRLDLNPDKAPDAVADFKSLPYRDKSFKAVVFDPGYKLSGTPAMGEMDERYGVDKYMRWQDKMIEILCGVEECARLTEEILLVKAADQVCSGKVVWQTYEITEVATSCGLRLADRFDMLSYRKQPPGRSQVHARRNASTMLVFKR